MAYRADKVLKEIKIIDNFKYINGATPGYLLHCIDNQGNAEWKDVNDIININTNIQSQIDHLIKCCRDNIKSIQELKEFINKCCKEIFIRLNKIENNIDTINDRLNGRIIEKPVYIKKEIPDTKPYTAQSGLYKRPKQFKKPTQFNETRRNLILSVSNPKYDFLINEEFFKIWQIQDLLKEKNLNFNVEITYKNIILDREYTIKLWEWEKSGISDVKKVKYLDTIQDERSNLGRYNFRKN